MLEGLHNRPLALGGLGEIFLINSVMWNGMIVESSDGGREP